jgi:hypothetical protein
MKIIVANEYTTPGGRKYKAGSTVEVDGPTGRSLIARGKAREALFHGRPVGQRPKTAKEAREAEETATAGSATAEDTKPSKGKGKD